MKLKTFTFLKHKIYLYSTVAIMLGGILSALPAFSQVDYYYGLNKKGIRVEVAVGATMLHSNWSSNPIGFGGSVSLDYDLSPYLGVGVQGIFGTLAGEDVDKLYFAKDAVTYSGGSFGIRLSVGQFIDSKTTTALQEGLKRIYLGVGVGMVNGSADLTKHTDGKGLSDLTVTNLAYGKTGNFFKTNGDHTTGSNSYPYVPINLGTFISLRGLLGNDKLEINPNLQYNYVLSPLFDGYQPNSVDIAPDPSTGNKAYKANGNQGFGVFSIGLRYKF